MNKIYKLTFIALAFASVLSCDLTENPQVDADRGIIFGTTSGLEAYSRSFYTYLPTPGNAFFMESGKCDYCACTAMDEFFMDGAFNAETNTSWSWGGLHNINYFLDGLKSEDCTVDVQTRNHYEGLGRWFRAYFYYDKLVNYGPVPWYDHCLASTELDLLYKDRDSRDVIISNIIADLDFAFNNIQTTSSVGSSLISKWAAAAFKSRVCLFEASFRRYHSITGEYTAEQLYDLAADAAKKVMDSGQFSLNTTNHSKGAYRDVFVSSTTLENEVLLEVCCSASDGILGSQNWRYNSASYGNHDCLSRAFVLSFLMKDGTSFTDKENYSTIEFAGEFTGRDHRLGQIVRSASYKRDGSNVVPDIVNQVAMTGYHIIKFSQDEKKYDNSANNPNGTPLIRYAEVLLNYAEAKAELGTLTDSEWSKTIGVIRKRAGISGGVSSLPTVLDPYMKNTFYPDVTNPVIMEIRRERAIELCLEGFRRNDLMRWKCGDLFERLPWTGIHISALDKPIDLNGDGTNDVYFSESAVPASSAYKAIWVRVNTGSGLKAVANTSGGYDLEYHVEGQRKWYSDGRQYLYPIPAKIIRDYAAEGYHLTQNPCW